MTPQAPEPGALNGAERSRYARHLALAENGEAGQTRLKHSSVLLVGTGGLGSPAALYLAAAGVGHLGLVDFDTVDLSNLQRQVLFGTAQIGQSKAEAARERLLQLNPIREGEQPSDWMERVLRIADERSDTPEPSRLPYVDREPGEDSE